jgi:hypothetical protein
VVRDRFVGEGGAEEAGEVVAVGSRLVVALSRRAREGG